MSNHVLLFEDYVQRVEPIRVETFAYSMVNSVNGMLVDLGFYKNKVNTGYTHEKTYDYERDGKILRITYAFGGKSLKVEIPHEKKMAWATDTNYEKTISNILEMYY